MDKYLVFSFKDHHEHFCVNVEFVKGILTTIPITGLPNRTKDVLGMVSIRGTFYPVLDLKNIMFEEPNPSAPLMLLTEMPSRGEDFGQIFLADAVHNIITIPEGSINTGHFCENAYMEGIFNDSDNEKLYSVISIPMLVDKFMPKREEQFIPKAA